MLKITIPKPCYEDWEAMTPNQQGRHCTACAKTVVDFTSLSDHEVMQFFLHTKEERVCGRFKQEQLHRIIITLPTNILQITMPRWKQFLTACLLAFSGMLFSCDALIDNYMKGEPVSETTDTPIGTLMATIPSTIDTIVTPVDTANCTTLRGDTVLIEYVTQGSISIEPPAPELIIAIVDSAMPFVGQVIIDSNIVTPINLVDSTKIKNPPKADSTNCNNMKYY